MKNTNENRNEKFTESTSIEAGKLTPEVPDLEEIERAQNEAIDRVEDLIAMGAGGTVSTASGRYLAKKWANLRPTDFAAMCDKYILDSYEEAADARVAAEQGIERLRAELDRAEATMERLAPFYYDLCPDECNPVPLDWRNSAVRAAYSKIFVEWLCAHPDLREIFHARGFWAPFAPEEAPEAIPGAATAIHPRTLFSLFLQWDRNTYGEGDSPKRNRTPLRQRVARFLRETEAVYQWQARGIDADEVIAGASC